MKEYKTVKSNSGISGFEIGNDFVIVRFRNGKLYRFSYNRAGREHVERMKVLAREGSGLTTYINKNVHELFDTDWP